MTKETESAQSRGRPKGQSKSECQCIGYLTRPALQGALGVLVKGGLIGHFWAVEHKPESNETKAHWHIRMTPPPSRTVDWAQVASLVVEKVDGESKVRGLVLDSRSCNNQSEDGLLYARHDSRYLRLKGMDKAFVDYKREEFLTDSEEWLSEQWAKADAFEPAPRKLTMADLLDLVESDICPGHKALLRLALQAGLNKGQWDMLREYRAMCESDRRQQDFKTQEDSRDE